MARRGNYAHEPHWHCCTACRQRYEDVCADPGSNQRCSECRLGNGWHLLRRGRAVRDCCVDHSVLLPRDERTRLKLAGSSDWWRCRICHRTQGFDPAIRVYPLEHKETA